MVVKLIRLNGNGKQQFWTGVVEALIAGRDTITVKTQLHNLKMASERRMPVTGMEYISVNPTRISRYRDIV